MIFDDRVCTLGEGPLWHPIRQEFFWFDIMERRLLAKDRCWDLGEYASAAGWIDRETLLIATQSALKTFDIPTGNIAVVTPLDADNPVTRSNDGRADPWGGFWIGTMGIKLEDKAGALYRFYKGELRQLACDITIPNATSFHPDGRTAFFADTAQQLIWRIALDADGWPEGDWQIFLDLTQTNRNPDGAVVDQDGTLWVAMWGEGRVQGFDANACATSAFDLPAAQTTCPAFGGKDLSRMLVTSAAEGLGDAARRAAPDSGKSFLLDTGLKGQKEHQVIL